jgi:hypothetical protein
VVDESTLHRLAGDALEDMFSDGETVASAATLVIDALRPYLRAPERESIDVADIDAEIAIAEAIQLMPRDTAYEDKGEPVLKYLNRLGYRIVDGSGTEEGGLTDSIRHDAVRDALQMLVYLKDIKKTKPEEYGAKKEAAWEDARSALALPVR